MPRGTVTGCCGVLLLLFWIFFISVIFLLRVTYIILFQSCVKYKKEVRTGSKWRNKGGKQSAERPKEWDRKQLRRQGSSRGCEACPVAGKSLFWVCFYMYANTQSQAHILFSFCLFLGLIRYKNKEPKSETKLWILQTKSFHWLKMAWQWPRKSIKIKDSIQVYWINCPFPKPKTSWAMLSVLKCVGCRERLHSNLVLPMITSAIS